MFQTDLVRVRLLQRLWWATVTADRPYTAPNPQLWTLWTSQNPKSKWGLWCGWMVPVVIVCIRAYHHWTPHHRHRHLACITKVVKGWSMMSFSALLFLHVVSSIKNTEFCLKPKLIFSSSFLFLLSAPQYSQTLPDKDDGWGRTLAPAKPGSFLGAERYWVGGGGDCVGQGVGEQRRWGGGVSCLAVPCAVHMVILPNEIIPYRVCLSLVFRLVAIDEVKAARRISLITSTSPPDSEPECGDL